MCGHHDKIFNRYQNLLSSLAIVFIAQRSVSARPSSLLTPMLSSDCSTPLSVPCFFLHRVSPRPGLDASRPLRVPAGPAFVLSSCQNRLRGNFLAIWRCLKDAEDKNSLFFLAANPRKHTDPHTFIYIYIYMRVQDAVLNREETGSTRPGWKSLQAKSRYIYIYIYIIYMNA